MPSGKADTVPFRIGHGFDIHRMVEGRPLRLGGVEIPFPRGLLGHSDGDVLLHAVCDALLGAAGEGDIGAHFPDTDERYRGAPSEALLETVVSKVRSKGWVVAQCDATIYAEQPRLAPYLPAMRRRLAERLGTDALEVKAKSFEGLGPVGRGEAVAATAVVLLVAGSL
ncbi:MAG: 2-C-methyl-D-erythritol 2,4-cyclodiphosphate synthase [Candidatus Binatia bacterium]|nr:MAG: 2-C-methyl-D-erythritol 2,4-cyclodiphosphate synthase [Candidatus Binatia bacterium]